MDTDWSYCSRGIGITFNFTGADTQKKKEKAQEAAALADVQLTETVVVPPIDELIQEPEEVTESDQEAGICKRTA